MIFNLIKHAKELLFDKTGTNLEADNVQDAITQISNDLSDIQHYAPKIFYKEITVNDITYSSGAIGTRAYQKAFNIKDYIPNAHWIISTEFTYISSSGRFYPMFFMSGDRLYLNAYRCDTSPVSNEGVTVRIMYAYYVFMPSN